MNKPEAIIIHHSVSSRDRTSFDQINEWHKVRWPNFKSELGWHTGYHYVIKGDGEVLQARKEDEEGAHTLGGWNRKSVGICLTGDFEHENPSTAQLEALDKRVLLIRQRWSIPREKVSGHGEKTNTKCPGTSLQRWVGYYRPEPKELHTPLMNPVEELQKKVDLYTIILNLVKQVWSLKQRLRKKK